LAVDVERCEPEEREEERAGDRERHGAGEHDERIAEALELRRQDEIDQDRREEERPEELAALHAKLARLARIVDGETGRQARFRLALEERERLVERDAGRDDA